MFWENETMQILPSKSPPEPALESASPDLLRRRSVATVLDVLVCYFGIESVLIAIFVELLPRHATTMGSGLFVWSVYLFVPIYLTYCFVLEWKYARTPGKSWMDLVVVTEKGDYPDLFACGLRNLFRYVDWLPVGYLLGWGVAKRSQTGQRIGDRFADTVVVRPKVSVDDEYVG